MESKDLREFADHLALPELQVLSEHRAMTDPLARTVLMELMEIRVNQELQVSKDLEARMETLAQMDHRETQATWVRLA